jgi:hypothetical protein
MLFDIENLFSDGQAATSTDTSANLVATGATRDPGAGEGVWVIVQVTEAFAAAGAATLTLAVQRVEWL